MRRPLSILTALLLAAGCGAAGRSGQGSVPDSAWPPQAPWASGIGGGPSSAGPAQPPQPQPPPPATTHPPGSPFTATAHGYDLSYPQCSAGRAPASADFAVVGVNGGKAFSLNPCFLRQWREASGSPRSLYLNSGYNPANQAKVLTECDGQAARHGGTSAQQLAYSLGCSTALDSLAALAQVRVGSPFSWWIDVENSNSWDEAELELNRLSLEGEIDQLTRLGRPVGVYSTFKDWFLITGGWSYPGISANWVAGRTPTSACAGAGFSGAPVWISQEMAAWPAPSGWDSDYAC